MLRCNVTVKITVVSCMLRFCPYCRSYNLHDRSYSASECVCSCYNKHHKHKINLNYNSATVEVFCWTVNVVCGMTADAADSKFSNPRVTFESNWNRPSTAMVRTERHNRTTATVMAQTLRTVHDCRNLYCVAARYVTLWTLCNNLTLHCEFSCPLRDVIVIENMQSIMDF